MQTALRTGRKKLQRKKKISVIIDNDMPSYADDPFFLKKANEMKDLLKKHPIPEHLLRNKK